jgi:hypothetical protein
MIYKQCKCKQNDINNVNVNIMIINKVNVNKMIINKVNVNKMI